MIGIRWLTDSPCGYLIELDEGGIAPSFTHEESARWEQDPTREVCIEVVPALEETWCRRDGIGLLVDTTKSTLVRVYAEDSWTELMEDGHSVRATSVDEGECWGEYIDSGWENARKIYDSIPTEERETWAEGIVAHPIYTAIVIKGRMDTKMSLKVAALKKVFGLPVIELL